MIKPSLLASQSFARQKVLLALALVLTVFGVTLQASPASSQVGAGQATVPVCEVGELWADQASCYVPAVTVEPTIETVTEVLSPSAFLPASDECPVGYDPITAAGAPACTRPILIVEIGPGACPGGSQFVQAMISGVCVFDEPATLVPCDGALPVSHGLQLKISAVTALQAARADAAPGFITSAELVSAAVEHATPTMPQTRSVRSLGRQASGGTSCTPGVVLHDCAQGFGSADGRWCISPPNYAPSAPTESVVSYQTTGGCPAGLTGPTDAGFCVRETLIAEPYIPVCESGILADFRLDGATQVWFTCVIDAPVAEVSCVDEPVELDQSPCAARRSDGWDLPSDDVVECEIGIPTPDMSACYDEVSFVTVPGLPDQIAICEVGTLLDIGNGAVCVFDIEPTVIGCYGRVATVLIEAGQNGTPGDDVILGTPGDDQIAAGDGNDIICGRGGNDRIWGGAGNDAIAGGAGDDRIRGGDGNDLLVGGTGADDLAGGRDNDFVLGGDGDDPVVRGGTGDDYVDGGNGDDLLVAGNGGSDEVVGGPGNDKVTGGPRPDHVTGSSGADEVKGNKGADMLWGGWGADSILGGPQSDDLLGGHDSDSCNGGTTGGDPAPIENDTVTDCEALVNIP